MSNVEPTRAPEFVPSSPTHRRAFTLLNTSTVPIWLAMILFPRAKATRWLAERAPLAFAGLGVAYTGLLVAAMAEGGDRPDFRDPDDLRRGMSSPTAFLAGWTHYLAFDLFVGRWIWEQNLAEGRSARLSLLLTWWFGPLGLTTELARRRLRRAP